MICFKSTLACSLVLAAALTAADQTTIRAALEPAQARKPAPEFSLQDAAGKTATLADYHGKVLLLDFWATWCHGCKEEIPWFAAFYKTYAPQGFQVVGASLDDDGWKTLKPFLAEHPIPYRVVLGDEAFAKRYAIENMPDTFLIDRHGRVAAAYRAGIVDRNDIEANIKSLLAEH
jgi:peroxiredoxin